MTVGPSNPAIDIFGQQLRHGGSRRGVSEPESQTVAEWKKTGQRLSAVDIP